MMVTAELTAAPMTDPAMPIFEDSSIEVAAAAAPAMTCAMDSPSMTPLGRESGWVNPMRSSCCVSASLCLAFALVHAGLLLLVILHRHGCLPFFGVHDSRTRRPAKPVPFAKQRKLRTDEESLCNRSVFNAEMWRRAARHARVARLQ